PYFGICLGMQIAVIEYARNVAGLTDACSGEFHDATDIKVIDFMPGQSDSVDKGGTLRLGSYPCVITPGTLMEKCYYPSGVKSGETMQISERHRHRYEFNNEYKGVLIKAGLVISGQSPDGELVETVEVPDNTFYIGVQFHPEFKSRPNRPQPIFRKFIETSLACK
ncbi:MAG: gamma-glutamyl-gamma-aminobutyrate hydrolase family protein, partial [Eubacterium sp.]|nr:gamma-glutamyl-gamma-aminobutyrate hydrolase family protein [Eubacterium sp.]